MSESEERLRIAAQWVEKAESDLRTARQTLKLKRSCPTDTICFHAQQCVERYLKSLLISTNVDFPRTHDLGELIARLPASIEPQLTTQEQDQLTEYATTTRYPGDYEPISIDDARRAVQMARRFRAVARKLLKKSGLHTAIQ